MSLRFGRFLGRWAGNSYRGDTYPKVLNDSNIVIKSITSVLVWTAIRLFWKLGTVLLESPDEHVMIRATVPFTCGNLLCRRVVILEFTPHFLPKGGGNYAAYVQYSSSAFRRLRDCRSLRTLWETPLPPLGRLL